MAVVDFVLIETVVSDEAGNRVAGPVGGIAGAYSAALEAGLTDFWADMSGGRIDLRWSPDVQLQVTQTLNEWSDLTAKQKIDEARAQARVPGATNILLIANDTDTPSAKTPSGSTPYVHAMWLSPAIVAHEMGHFFEWRGSSKGGHADVAREFFKDEYADPTCVMGGETNKLTSADPAIPAPLLLLNPLPTPLPNSRQAGPGMNPALVDQCGWVDPGSPLVRQVDPTTGGFALLQPWRGAPPDGSVEGAPVLAIVDGLDADGGRIYLCVRDEMEWDRGFGTLGFASPFPFGAGPVSRVLAYLSTPSGDSLLLGWMYAIQDSFISLGRVPLRVTVTQVTPEGVGLQLERSSWRGTAVLDGVGCDAAANIAVATWRSRVDAYVIDREGHVRFNHFNGHGWEYLPWPVIDGITCDPRGGIAAVARREGLIEIYVTAADGTVHRKQRLDWQWSPAWEPLPGGGLNGRSPLAAARIDDDTALLCGVRGDGQVSRVEVGDAGVLDDWSSAPRFQMRHVGATPDDDHRGRIYAVAADNPDRSIWATPDIASPDSRFWGPVGDIGPLQILTSAVVGPGEDVVVAGTDPLTALLWKGASWTTERLGDTRRLPAGGLAVFSREEESFEVAYIDPDGRVNVGSWSPRPDFRPAANQYEAQSTIVLMTGNGHFVNAKNGGGDGMGADSTQIGPWERLRMFLCQTSVINGGETRRIVAFQTQNGQYVGAVGGGGSHVIAEATTVGPWELFYLDMLPGGSEVTVQCIDQVHYWTAPGGGGGPLGADKSEPLDWEQFSFAIVS